MSRHRIPAVVVRLGTVLDCVVMHGGKLLTITEWKDWLLVASEGCFDASPGRAKLFLLPVRDKDTADAPRLADGHEDYERWNKRAAREQLFTVEVPDSVQVKYGRCVRIGYRSDKWHRRGRTIDYEHDFTEGGALAPLLYCDAPHVQNARAAVITGGDMRVTEDGLD